MVFRLLGLGCGLRFGFVCRAGDLLVVAENCVHQLHTSFQTLSSMVLEAGAEALVMEVAICLFGFEVGVGFGKQVIDRRWREPVCNACAQLPHH